MTVVNEIINKVCKPEFYAPEHCTLGGRSWTVKNWICNDITIKVFGMDYQDTVITAPGLKIWKRVDFMDHIQYQTGTEADAVALVKTL